MAFKRKDFATLLRSKKKSNKKVKKIDAVKLVKSTPQNVQQTFEFFENEIQQIHPNYLFDQNVFGYKWYIIGGRNVIVYPA